MTIINYRAAINGQIRRPQQILNRDLPLAIKNAYKTYTNKYTQILKQIHAYIYMYIHINRPISRHGAYIILKTLLYLG